MPFTKKIQINQQQQNKLLSTIVRLSFAYESILVKSISLISTFFITQTILDIVFPSFLLILGAQPYLEFFRNMVKMLFMPNSGQNGFIIQIVITQILLFVVMVLQVFILLLAKSQRIQEIGLHFLSFYYCNASFVMFFCASALISYIGMEPGDWVSLVGKIMSLGNLLLSIFLCVFYKMIAHTYSTVNSNCLCPRYDTEAIVQSILIKIISTIILTISGVKILYPQKVPTSEAIFILCECLFFLAAFSRLRKQCQYFTYIFETAAKIYRGCLVLEISCIFSTLLCLSTGQKLLEQNYLETIVCLTVFLYLAIRSYLGSRTQQYNLISQQQIKNGEQAILFTLQLNKILQAGYIKTAGLTQLFMIKNLFKKHEESCRVVDCFCKDEELDRDNLDQMIGKYKLLALNLMERYCEKFQENFQDVPKFILQAKLDIYQNFVGSPSLIKMSKKNKRKQISFLQAFFLKKYNLGLKQHIQKNPNYQTMAKIQKCFQCDNFYNNYLQKMQQVLRYRAEFWNKLIKNRINQQLQQKVYAQLGVLAEIDRTNELIVKNYCNLQLISLIIGYEKNILLKQKIFKEYMSYIKKLSLNHEKNKLQMYKKLDIEEIMYQRLSCTMQVSISQGQLGNILNTSKNMINVFGYRAKDLIGNNINKLIPNTMQNQHDFLMKNWLQTCSWERLGQLKNIFCISKSNICFSCRFYLKPIIREEKVNLIGYFIKDNDEDYMLLTENNLIIAAGSNFINLLGPNIINLPISILVQNRVQFKKISSNPNPTTRSFFSFNFYSTKSKTNQQLHKLYKGYTMSLQKQPSNNLPNCIAQQISDFHNETECYNIKFSLSESMIGRSRYRVIKLQNMVNLNENNMDTQKIVNDNYYDMNNSLNDDNQSNVFLNYDPSISSSSSQTQSTSTHNIIQKMQKIFFSKIPIYDMRSIRVCIIVVILGVLGCTIDVGKIYINQLGFKQMQQLLYLDNTYSDNIQLTMFIYNNVLTLDQHLLMYINNTKTSDASQRSFVSQLREELDQSGVEEDYLYDLIQGEIVEYNRKRTSLNNMNMYKFSNTPVLWRYLEQGREEDVTTMMFMSNFLYFSDRVQEIIVDTINLLNLNITAEKVEDKLLQNLVTQLDKNLYILYKNFPTLKGLSDRNLNYHSNLLKQTKSTLKLYSYIKMISLIIIFFVLLYTLNQHFNYREQQKRKIYEDYRYVTLDHAIGLQEYYEKLKKIVNMAVMFIGEDDVSQVDQEKRKNVSSSFMAKMNKINEEYNNDLTQNQNKTSTSLKLAIQKPGFSMLKIGYILIFVIIIALNILMQSAEQKILTKSSQIVDFINHLIKSENQLITTYFYYKAQPLTGITLTKKQLVGLLEMVRMVQVQFTEVAVNSLQLFAAYDPDYVSRMTKILTESVCELTLNDFQHDYYERCVQDQEMKIINYGVINGMNYFSRKVENLIEKQLQNYQTSSTTYYSLPEVDKTMFYMFKTYQKAQRQIADSLSVAADHQKTQYLLEIAIELLILLIFLGYVVVFFRTDKRHTLIRIGKILLLPIGIIKNNSKILRSFEKAVDFTSIKEQ